MTALDGVDLMVGDGERLAIVGPSAAGKSTLLRVIAGVERPDAGSVWIDQREMTHMPAWKRPVRLLIQEPALVPYWLVERNVTFGSRPSASDRALIEQLGLSGLERRRPATLSGGQRQRVALARALRGNPRVLLLDEPLSRLDPPARLELRTLIAELATRRQLATVLVTHDAVEAITFGHRLAVLIRGRIAQVDRPLVVYAQPDTVEIAAMLGDPPMNLIPVSAGMPAPGGAAWLGIRAERLVLGSPPIAPQAFGWTGRIVHVESRADCDLVRFQVPGGLVWIRRRPQEPMPPDPAAAVFDPRDAVWFDRDGRRIAVAGARSGEVLSQRPPAR
jgi:ABC-type sugar transport system ATPase subunit